MTSQLKSKRAKEFVSRTSSDKIQVSFIQTLCVNSIGERIPFKTVVTDIYEMIHLLCQGLHPGMVATCFDSSQLNLICPRPNPNNLLIRIKPNPKLVANKKRPTNNVARCLYVRI